MPDSTPRRLTLLYQLWLTNQAARNLMRQAMSASDMSGEEYALYSYLYANGARTLSQAARDVGMPITTLATLLAPGLGAGEIVRTAHPRDGRAKLLRLTDAGRARLERAMPAFTAGYRAVLDELAETGADVEALYAALVQLREGIEGGARRLSDERLAPAATGR
jgi:DNA-binding MarR family transcriptional regulator